MNKIQKLYKHLLDSLKECIINYQYAFEKNDTRMRLINFGAKTKLESIIRTEFCFPINKDFTIETIDNELKLLNNNEILI